MRSVSILGLALALALSANAAAAPVLVLDHGHARAENDPYLPAADLPPAGRSGTPGPALARVAGRPRTVGGELRRMLAAGAIDRESYDARLATLARARAALRRLGGRRRLELAAPLRNLREVAAAGLLTASRLEPLFLTVERNRRWWTTGPLLAPAQRVRFEGSRLIWQYYPGQGIQLQMLANFGRANGYWGSGKDADLADLLDELVGLGAERAGGIAWEYYFHFDGGRPPWTSGLSQGTAIQVLARAAVRLHDSSYFDIARRGLALFEAAPPSGVRVATPAGAHYLIYSFSRVHVLNAFTQALIGLSDFATIANDAPARRLFDEGEGEAQLEVPRFDTGAWSLYSPGLESDLGYHRLLTGFLRSLCVRTGRAAYCDTAAHFKRYLSEPPRMRLATRRARARRPVALTFLLSKRSRVAVTVLRAGRPVLATAGQFGHGRHAIRWVPRRAGRYAVRIVATDLAGNTGRTAASVLVVGRAKRVRRT